MTGKADPDFWTCFNRLPSDIQAAAREKYRLWAEDPFHPSLYFKELTPSIWSVRINRQYRDLGRRSGDLIVWYWIGTHTEYDRLIK